METTISRRGKKAKLSFSKGSCSRRKIQIIKKVIHKSRPKSPKPKNNGKRNIYEFPRTQRVNTNHFTDLSNTRRMTGRPSHGRKGKA